MIQILRNRKAISAALTTVLFVAIMLIAALMLYNFVNTNVDNIFESEGTFSLRIRYVAFNQTCMRIDVSNTGDIDAVIEKVYINEELTAFTILDHDLKIPAGTAKEIYIFGSYVAGCNFDIKIVFESGNSIWTLERW
jgi:hypothetical protein